MSREADARPMRVCFLGCGSVADAHSGRLARLRPGVTLAYASRSAPKAQALASKHGGARAFASYREAIDSPDVDVVAVVTPPASHREWTLAALEAGKDVILEKPPVLRSAELREIQQICAARGRFVYVAENYFYKPILAAVRDAIAAGAIGEPLFIHLNAVKRQRTANWRDDPAEAGGGALFEGGIHWVNFAGALGFTIASVKAARPGKRTRHRRPDVAMNRPFDSNTTLPSRP
jgi:predicted dehydrogenase